MITIERIPNVTLYEDASFKILAQSCEQMLNLIPLKVAGLLKTKARVE